MVGNWRRVTGKPAVEQRAGGGSWLWLALGLLVAIAAIAWAILSNQPSERQAAPATQAPPAAREAAPRLAAPEPLPPTAPAAETASVPQPAVPPAPVEAAKPAATPEPEPEVAVRRSGPAPATQDPKVPAVPTIVVERRPLADRPPDQPTPASPPEADPPAGQSGFVRDAKTDCLVWLPSWRRGRQFAIEWQGGCAGGRADGEGLAISRVLPVDHMPTRLAGHFRDGVFQGAAAYSREVVKLERDDFLIALPAGGLIGAQFWLHRRFAGDLSVPLCIGADDSVLAVLPGHASRTDNEAIQRFMRRAGEQAHAVCPLVRRVETTVVPQDYGRVNEVNRIEFRPMVASAQVYLDDKGAWQITRYRNDEAAQKEREERAARRKEAERRGKEAAVLRANPDVRGVKLGMQTDQARAALGGELAVWKPAWRPEQEQDPYLRRLVEVVLNDGARLTLRFVSSLSGGELVSLGYEQRFTTGPPADEAIARLTGKYGLPDEVLQHSRDAPWTGSWTLRSKAEGVIGAFMKAHVRFDRNSREVELLGITIVDVNWNDADERAIYQRKREEALRQHEQGKSDRMKF